MKVKTNVRVGSGGKSAVSTDPATSATTSVSSGGGGGGGGGSGTISGGQAASIAVKAQASADYWTALQTYIATSADPTANMAAATAAMTAASATYTAITGYIGRCAGI